MPGCESQQPAQQTSPSVTAKFRSGLFSIREQADAKIFWLLVAQWAVVLSTSIAMAGRWKDVRLDTLSSAVVWVGVLSILPLALVLRSPGRWQARWTVVISQGIMSSLLWYVSGGRPDTHLHLFAWLVVLALYRDMSVLLATAGTALIGHVLVFGSSTLPGLPVNDPSQWFTHFIWLAWLLGETAFLTAFVMLDRQTLFSQLERENALSSLQGEFQEKFERVTKQLVEERDDLKFELTSLKVRHTSLESTRSQASKELLTLRQDIAVQGSAILKLTARPADAKLNSDWRAQWNAVRQQAQHLLRLVDLPSLEEQSQQHSVPDPTNAEQRIELAPAEKRAMLMMRNPLQQSKAVTALESEGYKVDVVPNGPRTYYSVMLNDYSLIVVDIDLPGDEGFDTLEALRLLPADRIGRSKSLFAVTSEMTSERVLRCTDLKVDGIFLKPLKAESLHQTLSNPTPARPAHSDRPRSEAPASWSNSGLST